MTNKGLGDLLHLAKLAMGRGKAAASDHDGNSMMHREGICRGLTYSQ